jgi:DNA-binding NarL/FixJ family response regulator
MLRIVIADDQRLLRDGIATILSLEEDLDVVGAAENGLEAVQMARSLSPQIVLMDIKMPVQDGIEALKTIKAEMPEVKVIMLTTFAEDKFIVEAMSAGADGFLLKDMPSERVVQTVRDAAAGQLMLPSSIAAKLAARLMTLTNVKADVFDEAKLKREGLLFTDRERRMILHMIEGSSNKQIAASLFMSEGTVRNYISVIYNKIGTNDRQAAVQRLKELLL